MYTYNFGGIAINIDVKPGRYVFSGRSATGKTYLCHLLNLLLERGEPVVTYTYRDWLLERPIPSGKKLLVLDRVDMYPEVLDKLTADTADIILADYKQFTQGPFAMVNVTFHPGEVYVTRCA